MATVYRARQEALARDVALKVVLPQFATDTIFRARFLREAQVSARINSPHVVTCYDAGESDGRLYMALELVTGGDLLQLVGRRANNLDEGLASSLLRDCLVGLEAVEAAGLVHRDLKPANIFLNDRGQAKLADLGLARVRATGDDRTTQPGMIMGTPAYMAPEQARGSSDLDIRADLFALGATLFHLLSGDAPYQSENAIGTLMKVLNDPVPDIRQRRTDLSPGLLAVLSRLMAKDRDDRYPSVHQAWEDMDCLVRRQAPRHVQVPTTSTSKSAAPTVETAQTMRVDRSTVKPTPPLTIVPSRPPSSVAGNQPSAGGTSPPRLKVDPAQMAVLVKRIVIEKDGSKASLVLASGASFPRFLLDQILEAAGIVFGINPNTVAEATRPTQIPRKIVLAKGQDPTPGLPGTSVKGERIPALDQNLLVRVADDGMTAWAYLRPGTLATRPEVEAEVRHQRLCYGLDPLVLKRLVDGPAPADGRLMVAKGRPVLQVVPEHFEVAADAEALVARSLQLRPVQPGAVIATWATGRPGKAGMDVYGREVAPRKPQEPSPEDSTGEGTELGRDQDGNLVLRATRSGCCQQQHDLCVRVIGMMEIAGDVGRDSPPIDTDDLVVVRGNVKAGASITSSADVVIMGDLTDAKINAGGSLEVAGIIRGGDQELAVAGTIMAQGLEVQEVVAGSVKISGEARGCRILATGTIDCARVIGGSLTAGADISCDSIGDRDGTTTEVWAGHHLHFAKHAKLLKLEERRIEAERGRLVNDAKQVRAEMDDEEARQSRHAGARFVNQSLLKDRRERLERLIATHDLAIKRTEVARGELVRQRQMANDLTAKGDNAQASLKVRVVAHAGAVLKVADMEPEVLSSPRLKFTLDLG